MGLKRRTYNVLSQYLFASVIRNEKGVCKNVCGKCEEYQ
ncbi:hypothetical protein DCCM_4199 [Desulfocucumis palustris]|uniref:Uncharacterized protein n=1 Tax=Desulfocucumis palustris TaxID=1898651 RepID=A0A2L2XLA6_9FIRM|nr:hypothetical protein DCCM_4199 [Desulfocucumis palustris]